MQLNSCTIIQLCNCTVVQLYHCTVVQLYSCSGRSPFIFLIFYICYFNYSCYKILFQDFLFTCYLFAWKSNRLTVTSKSLLLSYCPDEDLVLPVTVTKTKVTVQLYSCAGRSSCIVVLEGPVVKLCWKVQLYSCTVFQLCLKFQLLSCTVVLEGLVV